MNDGLLAVILAGVHDWGGCILNRAMLRPLVPVANRRVIEHVLAALGGTGVSRAVICTNGHGQRVRDALGDFFVEGMHLSYRDDAMPRGPAGCIKDAVGPGFDGHVVSAEASLLPCFDVDALVDDHLGSGASLTVAVSRRSAADSDDCSPVGAYVVSADALALVPDKGFCDIKEGLIPKLHQAGRRVATHTIRGVAARLHGISSYFAVNDWAVKLAGRGGWGLDGYARHGDAVIHVDARVDASVPLLGPVMIGPFARIQEGAIVVGPTSIDRGATVSAHAVVVRSALWEGAAVDRWAEIDRCVVGQHARVAEGERLSNTVCVTARNRTARAGAMNWMGEDADAETAVGRVTRLGMPVVKTR